MNARLGTLIVLGLFVGAFQTIEFATHGSYTTPPLIGILAPIAVAGYIGVEGIDQVTKAVRKDKPNDKLSDKS